MSENKLYPMKLTDTFRFGMYKGNTLQWVIDNKINYVKYLHREKAIGFNEEAWVYFLEKAGAGTGHKKVTTTFFKRHVRR